MAQKAIQVSTDSTKECARVHTHHTHTHTQKQANRALFVEIKALISNTSLRLRKTDLYLKGLFTWSGGPRSSGVGFFCFHALGDTKQKKPTPLNRGPPLLVNRILDCE